MKLYIISAGIVAATWAMVSPKVGHTDVLTARIVDVNTEDVMVDGKIVHREWEPSEKHKRAEKLLAGMLFGECRGEGIVCMRAVGHVAMNRARLNLDKRYGKGLWGVLNKHKAFSCLNKNDPNRKVIMRAQAGKLKPGSADAKRWDMALEEAHHLMHRESVDPTNGATHYHAHYVKPIWIHDRGMKKSATIDGHIFYRKDA